MTSPVVAFRTAKLIAPTTLPFDWVTVVKSPPIASSFDTPSTLVIARMSPLVRENVSGVVPITVVGETPVKFGLNAAACKPLTAGAGWPQSADAGRSFIALGASIAVHVPVLADAAEIAPAVVATIANTDKPTAAAEKPLRITIPPRGQDHGRVRPRVTSRQGTPPIANLVGKVHKTT